jgi:hypothetical protein
MKKENQNIQLHIIDEDYKAKKNKQNGTFLASGKAIYISDLQKDAFAMAQLRKQHDEFADTNEPGCFAKEEDPDQKEPLGFNELMNSLEVSELFACYEKLRREENELEDSKQELLEIEHGLRVKLNREIHRKKKSIEELEGEISAIKAECNEIEQVLGLPTN